MKIDLKYSFSRDGGPQNIYKDQSRPEHWVQISGCWLNISNKADMTIATQISLNSTGIEISGSETLWLDPDRVSLVFRSLNCGHTDINTWRERERERERETYSVSSTSTLTQHDCPPLRCTDCSPLVFGIVYCVHCLGPRVTKKREF